MASVVSGADGRARPYPQSAGRHRTLRHDLSPVVDCCPGVGRASPMPCTSSMAVLPLTELDRIPGPVRATVSIPLAIAEAAPAAAISAWAASAAAITPGWQIRE